MTTEWVAAADPVPAQGAAPATGETSAGDPSAVRVPRTWPHDSLPQPYPRAEADDPRVRFLLGVAANTSPNFFGGPSQHFKLKPVGALDWGRWRLSTGGGYGLMGQGRRERGSGAQAMLRETDRFNLSLSLNIDRGRDVADTERLKGVPDVRATVRARLRARYNLTDRWTASLAASQDILGRGRGMELDGWLGYRWPISQATRVDFGLGASWGNSQYMRSQFGIPQGATTASGYPAFKPGAGLYQTEIGVDIAHALSRSWVVFGGMRYSQLHGDARRSPLTVRSKGVSASVGIAWRN
ncbi:MAG: MipA/OmpV family protein [Burkholderiales bacterium]|nr:MipA/OmpV family protein [Burkholderiales bacterium]MBK8666340.1 MipA/OmpV family protein [Burkholderiales bacterium]